MEDSLIIWTTEKLTPPKSWFISKKIYFVINITSLYQNYATCGHNIIFSFDVTVIQWKTCPFITERLLMGRKESNQTKNQTVYFAEACENASYAFWQTPYHVWSVRSLNSRWNQILYCLKILSTNCLQIYNLLLLVPLLFEHTLCHYEQNSTWWL